MNIVHRLRKSGLKIRIEHRRRYFDPVNKRYSFLTKYERSLSPLPVYVTMMATGGNTTVTVTDPTTGITTQGVSKCSKHDLYEKRTGVIFALNKALGGTSQLGAVKEQLEFPFVETLGCGCGLVEVCPTCKCH